LKFSKTTLKEIQVLIEGFTIDDQFISEIKKLGILPKL